ncbi:MAG TPA: group II intron maturase-specific domain-containing protein [Terrimicrobiaceae bacterium]|nr:group II intron maturase-specific domain-containing protein [Terrimicrobiaceae bacterium]
MQELRDCVRALTRRTIWKDKEAVVNEINRVTTGWGNYFALAHYHRIFRQMNGFTAHRLRQWLWRKHGNASGKYRRWPDYQLFQNHGLYELPTRIT